MNGPIPTAPKTEQRAGRRYTFRPVALEDGPEILSLYGDIWEERLDTDWFNWRYAENPYVDYLPVFAIETDGRIVAARPFLVLPMRVGSTVTLALQSVDTMVHPDHRRRGLFSWMTAEAVQFFIRREPSFIFNQPNAVARDGYLQLGWQEVNRIVTYYRIQQPAALLGARQFDTVGRVLGAALRPAVTGYLDVKNWLAVQPGPYTVDVVDGVDSERLADLYQRNVPSAIHAYRDRTYYQWRFASPAWHRATYVATRGEKTVAAMLTRTRETNSGITLTQLADVVPLSGDRRWMAALTALLNAIVDRHRSSDLIAAPREAFAASLLHMFGFQPDDRFPLSHFKSSNTILLARSLTADNERTVGGMSLTEPDNWLLAYGERDTI